MNIEYNRIQKIQGFVPCAHVWHETPVHPKRQKSRLALTIELAKNNSSQLVKSGRTGKIKIRGQKVK